jgi:crotonobetainyl-CoA:carnitine CoA-transferase CaiB-like acyl-CoA transferase
VDRILEIGSFAAGFCGRLFAQAGHEVVRVETTEPAPGWVSKEALDLFLHPGKRRLQTNDPGLITELASQADIVIVEAANADALEALRFDDMKARLKISITPFGRTGPKRNWHATSSVLLAMGGYTYLMGDEDRAPLTLPGHFVDFESGQYAYTAANACRLAGEANNIDVSMLEVVMSLSQFTTVRWHCGGEIRSRHGSEFWTVPPSNLFACQDGWIYMNIVPIFWDAFATFLDRPELVIDERFLTNDLRMKNRVALNECIQEVVLTMTKKTAQERAVESRVPVGIVQTLDDVLDDPHLLEREFWQQVHAAGHDSIRSPSLPFRFNNAPRPVLALTKPEEI